MYLHLYAVFVPTLANNCNIDPVLYNVRYCNTSNNNLKSLNPYDHCTSNEPCQDTFCALPEFPVPEEHLKVFGKHTVVEVAITS